MFFNPNKSIKSSKVTANETVKNNQPEKGMIQVVGRQPRRDVMLYNGPQKPIWMGPPALPQQTIRRWTLRFAMAANAASQTLSSSNLASMLGIFSTSVTTSVFITESFRIRRIRAWATTSIVGVSADLQLKISDAGTTGGQSGPPCTIGDSSSSIDKPAFCQLKIPESSIFARWQDVASTNDFLTYYSDMAGIMDIDFEFILDDLGVLVAGPALSAASPFVLYHKNVATLNVVNPLNGI